MNIYKSTDIDGTRHSRRQPARARDHRVPADPPATQLLAVIDAAPHGFEYVAFEHNVRWSSTKHVTQRDRV